MPLDFSILYLLCIMISVIQEFRTAFLDAAAVSAICTEKVLVHFDATHLLSPQSIRE